MYSESYKISLQSQKSKKSFKTISKMKNNTFQDPNLNCYETKQKYFTKQFISAVHFTEKPSITCKDKVEPVSLECKLNYFFPTELFN